MAGQRIGYIRVSTLDQQTERQLDRIALDQTFTDKASGKDQGSRMKSLRKLSPFLGARSRWEKGDLPNVSSVY